MRGQARLSPDQELVREIKEGLHRKGWPEDSNRREGRRKTEREKEKEKEREKGINTGTTAVLFQSILDFAFALRRGSEIGRGRGGRLCTDRAAREEQRGKKGRRGGRQIHYKRVPWRSRPISYRGG